MKHGSQEHPFAQRLLKCSLMCSAARAPQDGRGSSQSRWAPWSVLQFPDHTVYSAPLRLLSSGYPFLLLHPLVSRLLLFLHLRLTPGSPIPHPANIPDNFCFLDLSSSFTSSFQISFISTALATHRPNSLPKFALLMKFFISLSPCP